MTQDCDTQSRKNIESLLRPLAFSNNCALFNHKGGVYVYNQGQAQVLRLSRKDYP